MHILFCWQLSIRNWLDSLCFVLHRDVLRGRCFCVHELRRWDVPEYIKLHELLKLHSWYIRFCIWGYGMRLLSHGDLRGNSRNDNLFGLRFWDVPCLDWLGPLI